MLAVPAENGGRPRPAVDYDAVPCIAALALMTYDTSGNAGKASDAAASVYLNSLHSVSIPPCALLFRNFLEPADSAFIIGLSGVLIIAGRCQLIAFNIMDRGVQLIVRDVIRDQNVEDCILPVD